MTGDYAEKLEAGLQYQDFVMEQLHRIGIVLQPVFSRKEQLRRENLLGLEIKYDRLVERTGNLYIETHEKSNAANINWICSGILRDDESWLYGIGNEKKFWIFAKRTLREVYRSLCCSPSKWEGVEFKSIATSKGFIIPASLADTWAAKIVTFDNRGR